jgi:enoyl-CoA hydratase/carnithine racemase
MAPENLFQDRGCHPVCDAIGVRQVSRYALTGERLGAQEARRIGVAHEVVPLAELSDVKRMLAGVRHQFRHQ